jgi:hypothetical protein
MAIFSKVNFVFLRVHQMGGLQEAWEGSSDDSMDGIDQMVP